MKAALMMFTLFSALVHANPLPAANAPRLPEFTQTSVDAWLNSPPLRVTDLRGAVLLLDFWTFDCWNCYRSIPWLKAVESQHRSAGLRVVGVHTPEFARERLRANVARKLQEFGITHPVMMDNDFAYWHALQNRVWPAFYLADRQGRVRARFFGETHAGDSQAARIESAIEALLAER